jgi:hypothetical protein
VDINHFIIATFKNKLLFFYFMSTIPELLQQQNIAVHQGWFLPNEYLEVDPDRIQQALDQVLNDLAYIAEEPIVYRIDEMLQKNGLKRPVGRAGTEWDKENFAFRDDNATTRYGRLVADILKPLAEAADRSFKLLESLERKNVISPIKPHGNILIHHLKAAAVNIRNGDEPFDIGEYGPIGPVNTQFLRTGTSFGPDLDSVMESAGRTDKILPVALFNTYGESVLDIDRAVGMLVGVYPDGRKIKNPNLEEYAETLSLPENLPERKDPAALLLNRQLFPDSRRDFRYLDLFSRMQGAMEVKIAEEGATPQDFISYASMMSKYIQDLARGIAQEMKVSYDAIENPLLHLLDVLSMKTAFDKVGQTVAEKISRGMAIGNGIRPSEMGGQSPVPYINSL